MDFTAPNGTRIWSDASDFSEPVYLTPGTAFESEISKTQLLRDMAAFGAYHATEIKPHLVNFNEDNLSFCIIRYGQPAEE